MSGGRAHEAGARVRAGLCMAALPLAVAALLLAAGCSPRGGAGGAGRGGAAATGPVRRHVTMHGVRFDPANLDVAVGDTVEWDNHDIVPHTSTATGGAWFSGNIGPDSSWSTVIHAAGTFPYACSYHTQMKAVLVAR